MDSLDDFTTFPFSDGQWQRTVYRKGSGPAVIVMHEMPGITPACVHFACRVVDAGFTVFMPSLFGRPGEPPTGASFAREYVQLCVNREFSLLAANHASPATDWLRALARRAFDEIGGRGVGAVGMCITGNFALTMALDPHLLAPVLSQPALPWSPFGGSADDVHAAPATLATLRRRHEQDPGFRVIGLRFEGDRLCKGGAVPDARARARRRFRAYRAGGQICRHRRKTPAQRSHQGADRQRWAADAQGAQCRARLLRRAPPLARAGLSRHKGIWRSESSIAIRPFRWAARKRGRCG